MSRHDLGAGFCKRICVRRILTPLRLCAGNGSPELVKWRTENLAQFLLYLQT